MGLNRRQPRALLDLGRHEVRVDLTEPLAHPDPKLVPKLRAEILVGDERLRPSPRRGQRAQATLPQRLVQRVPAGRVRQLGSEPVALPERQPRVGEQSVSFGIEVVEARGLHAEYPVRPGKRLAPAGGQGPFETVAHRAPLSPRREVSGAAHGVLEAGGIDALTRDRQAVSAVVLLDREAQAWVSPPHTRDHPLERVRRVLRSPPWPQARDEEFARAQRARIDREGREERLLSAASKRKRPAFEFRLDGPQQADRQSLFGHPWR